MEAQELKNQIGRVVDQWVSEVLRSRFLEKPQGQKPRSLWDRFKQGVTNWWWGPEGDKYNKYKWRNRFGDELGVSESFDPSVFTLHEYMEIRGLIDSVEARLDENEEGFDSLRLMQIVRSSAESLKTMLFNTLAGRVDEIRPSPAAEQPVAAKGNEGGNEVPSPESPGKEPGGVPPVTRVEDPRKGANGPKKKASPPDGAGAVRKSNAQRIREAADEVANMDDAQRHALKPEKDWFREGSIRRERIPHLIAWMAMRTHRDPLNDDHIRQELKDALGSEVNLGLPLKAGSLKKYLRLELGSGFEGMMSKLGVGAEDVGSEEGAAEKKEKPAVTEKKTEKPSVEPDKPDSSKQKEEAEADEGKGRGESDDLRSYLYDGSRPRDVEQAARLIFDFIEKISDKMDEDKRERLEDWFDSEMEHLENKDKRDAFDHLQGSLLSSEAYLDKMSEILGIDRNSIRMQMEDYIKSRNI